MPQASERSLATPMIRPCFPVISAMHFPLPRPGARTARPGRATARTNHPNTKARRPANCTGPAGAAHGACLPGEIGHIGSGMDAAETGRRPHPFMILLRRKLSAAGGFSLYALNRFNQDGCFAASGALSYTTL